MSAQDPKELPADGAGPAPAAPDKARSKGTGEGAATALQALIRKRKLAENPDEPDTQSPATPAP